jgi:small GTP-binding protein
MILMKVCLLGSFAAGKTSLATRFTESMFSDRYHTTVGVRIHKKEVNLDGVELKIVVWDLAGEDELVKLRVAYLRGSSGYVLVVDATRPETIHVALRLQATAEEAIGAVPCILVVNKLDLVDEAATQKIRAELDGKGLDLWWTSAKTGHGVEQAFLALAKKMIAGVRP